MIHCSFFRKTSRVVKGSLLGGALLLGTSSLIAKDNLPAENTKSYSYAGSSKGSGDKWPMYLEVQGKKGNFRNLARFMWMWPVWQDDNNMCFVDVRYMTDNQREREGNFGFGYRHIIREWDFLSDGLIVGAYGFYDRRRSSLKNYFNQGVVGVEALGEYFQVRANRYMAQNKSYDVSTTFDAATDVNSGWTVSDDNRYVLTYGSVVDATVGTERSLNGYDGEVRGKINLTDDFNVWLGVGGYRFSRGGIKKRGPMAIADLELLNLAYDGTRISLGYEYRKDKGEKANKYGVLKLSTPLACVGKSGSYPKLGGIDYEMTRFVERDVDIQAGTSSQAQTQETTASLIIDPTTLGAFLATADNTDAEVAAIIADAIHQAGETPTAEVALVMSGGTGGGGVSIDYDLLKTALESLSSSNDYVRQAISELERGIFQFPANMTLTGTTDPGSFTFLADAVTNGNYTLAVHSGFVNLNPLDLFVGIVAAPTAIEYADGTIEVEEVTFAGPVDASETSFGFHLKGTGIIAKPGTDEDGNVIPAVSGVNDSIQTITVDLDGYVAPAGSGALIAVRDTKSMIELLHSGGSGQLNFRNTGAYVPVAGKQTLFKNLSTPSGGFDSAEALDRGTLTLPATAPATLRPAAIEISAQLIVDDDIPSTNVFQTSGLAPVVTDIIVDTTTLASSVTQSQFATALTTFAAALDGSSSVAVVAPGSISIVDASDVATTFTDDPSAAISDLRSNFESGVDELFAYSTANALAQANFMALHPTLGLNADNMLAAISELYNTGSSNSYLLENEFYTAFSDAQSSSLPSSMDSLDTIPVSGEPISNLLRMYKAAFATIEEDSTISLADASIDWYAANVRESGFDDTSKALALGAIFGMPANKSSDKTRPRNDANSYYYTGFDRIIDRGVGIYGTNTEAVSGYALVPADVIADMERFVDGYLAVDPSQTGGNVFSESISVMLNSAFTNSYVTSTSSSSTAVKEASTIYQAMRTAINNVSDVTVTNYTPYELGLFTSSTYEVDAGNLEDSLISDAFSAVTLPTSSTVITLPTNAQGSTSAASDVRSAIGKLRTVQFMSGGFIKPAKEGTLAKSRNRFLELLNVRESFAGGTPYTDSSALLEELTDQGFVTTSD